MTRKEMTGGSTDFDKYIWQEIEELIQDNNIPLKDVIESFAMYARRINFTKMLAFYELFKMSLHLPGDILECGVYRGNTLLTLSKFLEIFTPANRLKKVIGFDNFKGFENFNEKDGQYSEKRGKVIGGWNSADFKETLKSLVEIHDKDSFLPRASRVELVEGDICETVPEYVGKNPGLRLSLLHLNCNLYEPTKTAMEYLYPRVVKGGVVICAEYAMKEWAGETTAIEEYFGSQMVKMERFDWHNQPNSYFIKQ